MEMDWGHAEEGVPEGKPEEVGGGGKEAQGRKPFLNVCFLLQLWQLQDMSQVSQPSSNALVVIKLPL